MSTIDTVNEASRSRSRLSLSTLLPYLLGRYDLAARRYRSRRALADLDDHMLADIGLSRKQARTESGRPFWD